MRTSRQSIPVHLAAGLASALLAVSACDNPQERLDAARTLVDAAVDQVAGGDGPAAPGDMERVPVEARAYAGEILNEMTIAPAARSRFAIGSVVAKPKDLPPLPEPTEALMMQRPELIEEMRVTPSAVGEPGEAAEPAETEAAEAPAQLAETAPRTQRPMRALSRERVQLDGVTGEVEARLEELREKGEIRRLDPKQLRALPRDQRQLALRAVPTDRAIAVQIDARSEMLAAMSEFGLDGTVSISRAGEMVIDVGEDAADPTQFVRGQGSRANLPQFAINARLQCPRNPSPELLARSKMLATQCVVERLRASGQFEYVEKDFIFEHQFARRPAAPPIAAVVTPDDPLWSLQWHFQDNGDGPGQSPGGASFVDFWSRQATQGSDEVVVAVVDTGLQMNHPDIAGSPNVAPGWDMVSDPRMGNDGDGRDSDPNDPGDLCDPSDPRQRDTFHGTHVAGTIGAAASNNSVGVAGGAWNVKIVPVRALGKCGGRLTDINDAIRWAGGLVPAFDDEGNEVWNDNPADIINLSIGLFEFCPASLQDAINAVTERGVVVVSAAGNARVSTRFYSPGGCENVVSVAAGDARGVIAPYSNYGDEVDVLAPGGDLTRDDNGDGRPDGVLSTKQAQDCADPVTGQPVASCFYAYEQGTSMAAPHVSAALALIKAKQPELIGSALAETLLTALEPRAAGQCAGRCDQYPGFDPLPDNPDLCARPCGGGLLNLANLSLEETGSEE